MTLLNPGEELFDCRYKLEKLCSSGPVGQRWKVRQPDGIERVADIVQVGANDHLRLLCNNSARTKAFADYPNLVTILECIWLDDEKTYLQVLNLPPDSRSLHMDLIPRKPIEMNPFDGILQLLNGLASMHRFELVHGAISPYTTYGSKGKICFADLWWAHSADGRTFERKLEACINETRANPILPYLAPEVLRGGPSLRSSDVYSLGALVFFLLTGECPREEGNKANVQFDKETLLACPTTPLEFLRRDLDNRLTAVIHQMMSDDASARPVTPELVELLKHVCQSAV
jgi:eukaryotic-like serine/threonine-protein kinase